MRQGRSWSGSWRRRVKRDEGYAGVILFYLALAELSAGRWDLAAGYDARGQEHQRAVRLGRPLGLPRSRPDRRPPR